MKSKREHRVPLSKRAMEILKAVGAADPNAGSSLKQRFIFAGRRPSEPLSNMAMLELLKRMGRGDLTVHGFRSTFREWAERRPEFPRSVCEAALAHVNKDKTEAAYLRDDKLDERVPLMEQWARYCYSPVKPGKVLKFEKRKTAA
jgi:integrase